MTARTVWIVGGGSGVGRACALRCAGNGWNVVVSGRRPDAVAETVRLVEVAGGTATGIVCDITDPVSCTDAAREARERFDRLDAVVASAGLNAPRRTWTTQDPGEFEQIIATNLTGTARVVQESLPALQASRGTVVFISSYAGWMHTPFAGVAYSASKTAVRSLCRSLNSESLGIRACHLCPGDIDSDFLSLRPVVPDAAARTTMLSPDDVAHAVEFVLEAPPRLRVDELVISPVA